MESKYFKNDEYWKKHINEKLEDDIWIKDYKKYFSGKGICLDLGCGIGQYSKELMSYGYQVVSVDISDTALEKVKEFNSNIIKIDMQEKLPFLDNTFSLVFANLSIHYFSDKDTRKLMDEIKRVLRQDGLFIGSVNGIQGYEKIKDTAIEIEKHYWFNKNKYIRLFDEEDLTKYLNIFKILKIEEKETTRFGHKKNYIVFFTQKNEEPKEAQNKYNVITLCGPVKFKDTFLEVYEKFTLNENIVLTPNFFNNIKKEDINPYIKKMLVEMHKQKIDMSDEIYVINVNGYIGENTKAEIEYAKLKGKKISYLEPIE